MTKMEIIDYILRYDFDSIQVRLDKLMEENRITGGARFYVYNPYQIYSFNQVQELLYKASKSKNYFRYIKRVDSIQFNVWLRMFNEDVAKIVNFLEEQEAPPFEQSQKQVLIQKGELK